MIIGFVIREPFFIYLSQIANLLHLVWIIYITCPMPQNPSKLQIVSVPLIYKSCCFTLKKNEDNFVFRLYDIPYLSKLHSTHSHVSIDIEICTYIHIYKGHIDLCFSKPGISPLAQPTHLNWGNFCT